MCVTQSGTLRAHCFPTLVILISPSPPLRFYAFDNIIVIDLEDRNILRVYDPTPLFCIEIEKQFHLNQVFD